MEIKEIINVIKTEFKKSKLSSILNKGESYLIEDYVQFIATCPMALPFAENYKFANKEFNKEYYDLFDSVEAWKNLKGKGYKKFLQVADDDIIVDEKITFGIDVCVTDNSINYYILTHEFEDPFFKEYPLYFGNEKELKFILGTVFDNLSLMESKTSARNSIKESADDNWYKLKMLNEMLDAMEEDEYNIPKLGIYGVTKNIDLDEGAIRALIKYYK